MLAQTIGWAVRAAGRQAAATKELEPAHRRDGFGLLALGLAVVLAVAVWFDAAGPAGFQLAQGVRAGIGALAAALPLLLLAGAVRLMRHPGDPAHRGRHIVGWGALLLGAVGLLHLFRGQPQTLSQQRYAGGVAGELLGGGLAAALTPWLATPLLLLLTGFGLLVVTATPVNRVPERLAQLRDLAMGRAPAPTRGSVSDEDDVAAEDVPAPRRSRSTRRRQAAFAADSQSPDDVDDPHPTIAIPRKRPSAPAKRPATPIPLRQPPEHSHAPTRAEQLALSGAEGDYKLPPSRLLKQGVAPKTRSKVNDQVIAALQEVFEQFNVDAAVTGFT
ncbi:MAG: DNA translocase FtsK 4TM domain-containing protein, partial [Micromonosporaceae bacterium]